jgi:hypothetical protein
MLVRKILLLAAGIAFNKEEKSFDCILSLYDVYVRNHISYDFPQAKTFREPIGKRFSKSLSQDRSRIPNFVG